MKYKITVDYVVLDGVRHNKGSVVDLDDYDGLILVLNGQAERVEDKPADKPESKPAEVHQAEDKDKQ